MPGRLQREIKQNRPFESREAEATINLLRTADLLSRHAEAILKAAGLSLTQYNVLRILRGAGAEGLPCGEIAARMITRDPDITRLLDRLERGGLVSRARDACDRRVVTTRIEPAGLRLLKRLDAPMATLHRRLLGHLGPRRLRALIALLEEARQNPSQPGELRVSPARGAASKESSRGNQVSHASRAARGRPTK